ncbi:hypothetical protein BJV74DRAFT_890217 [Russula compacta]|nr:hypothetical protein BJV74DRAFT_890217 [Russula compacta]
MYQQALYLLPNPKEDPKLRYGIGILYDCYGSLDHAEEPFSSILRMDKDFDRANEILFHLRIIYKQQGKYDESLTCFDHILCNPPNPLAHADIWFQIGHVYEQQKDHVLAKDTYERVVADNSDLAISYLTKSLEADPSDTQSWYLLGRAYMASQKYNKAYEAYQQAVYHDSRNPTFWCSIRVLYFQINQFCDTLDAYSWAICINPYISEVWFDLGSLYESCNNQISDVINAYARASKLDPSNPMISHRLKLLKTAQATGGQLLAVPSPQDVHPTAYSSAIVPPPSLTGLSLILQAEQLPRPIFCLDSRGPDGGLPLPPPSQVGAGWSSPGPFRGGPPPPVILDETCHIPSHPPLAPMEVDCPPHTQDYSGSSCDGPSCGPIGHQNLLLHHPLPQQQVPAKDIWNGSHGPVHLQESYFTRPHHHPPSCSVSPPPHPSCTHTLPELGHPGPIDPDMHWEHRGAPPNDHPHDWDWEHHPGTWESTLVTLLQAFYSPHSPGLQQHAHSPSEHSPWSCILLGLLGLKTSGWSITSSCTWFTSPLPTRALQSPL